MVAKTRARMATIEDKLFSIERFKMQYICSSVGKVVLAFKKYRNLWSKICFFCFWVRSRFTVLPKTASYNVVPRRCNIFPKLCTCALKSVNSYFLFDPKVFCFLSIHSALKEDEKERPPFQLCCYVIRSAENWTSRLAIEWTYQDMVSEGSGIAIVTSQTNEKKRKPFQFWWTVGSFLSISIWLENIGSKGIVGNEPSREQESSCKKAQKLKHKSKKWC